MASDTFAATGDNTFDPSSMESVSSKPNKIDWSIFVPVIMLMLGGIAFVYGGSASQGLAKAGSPSFFAFSHAVKVLMGIGIILFFAKFDYNLLRPLSKPLLIGSVILLVLVLLIGTTEKGATRWIDLGFISFQPSEIAKFAIVIHFASMLSAKQSYIDGFGNGFIPFVFWTVLTCGLIALQPNFSTMAVIFTISFLIMFVGNVRAKYLGWTALFGALAGGVYFVSAEYRLNRLKAFFGTADGNIAENVSYQTRQALIALGNGGISGVGPGQSRQSELFLPESFGDFIFAVIGEEYGFIGLLIVISLYMWIFMRGMIVAKRAPNNFGYFLAIGIIITFAVYVFVNAMVNTNLLPPTGVPLPFISFGGTAIFIYSAAIGILLNISSSAGTHGISFRESILTIDKNNQDVSEDLGEDNEIENTY
jgi:cell division protein FtsW